MKKLIISLAAFTLLSACGQDTDEPAAVATVATPTESAEEFISRVNDELAELGKELGAAGWVRATYITEDTAILSATANERYAEWHSNAVKQAVQYDDQDLSAETRRALNLIKLGTSLPTPDDAAKRKELTRLATDLTGMYGAGQYCRNDNDCLSMREKYTRYVDLANEGANELGYNNLGEMWRAGYDMSAVEFETEASRLWEQVKPLYEELHCHVRAKLGERYGEDKVPQDGLIPAHLLGNMWAQEWGFIYDILEPYPGVSDLDVDSALKTKNYSPQEMVRSAEDFYVSLGLPRLPDTFWERSMFSAPADRDVVCHASAWGLDGGNDLRIKMCIKQTYDELRVIYHELGHNYYQGAYKDQPALYQDGANSGFHEAIGDAITLSMTPKYLAEVGLVNSAEQSEQAILNRQMQQALDKIAFLPFGKLIDEWRWAVFSGEISADEYNKGWWDLRAKYQGIAPPVERSEADFDPGAKYHIPANVSYTRYFLARILQFQFQRALCAAAGHEGDLSACSIYGSKEAGARLEAMLAAGSSEPWQDTLEKLTGTREMDATAIIDYFEPLMGYLKEQNEGRSCGW
jgi:peptidyl-dipeptidase A